MAIICMSSNYMYTEQSYRIARNGIAAFHESVFHEFTSSRVQPTFPIGDPRNFSSLNAIFSPIHERFRLSGLMWLTLFVLWPWCKCYSVRSRVALFCNCLRCIYMYMYIRMYTCTYIIFITVLLIWCCGVFCILIPVSHCSHSITSCIIYCLDAVA